MFPRYRQKTIRSKTWAGVLTAVAVLVAILSLFLSSERNEAKEIVDTFYRYEQAGDFGSSWELFHPLMKTKFPKDVYIQRRAHVFMQDFGAETFEYRLDEAEHLSSWSMSDKQKPFQDVYRIRVIQTFHSVFGVFELHQDVFVAKKNGKWGIVFSYDL
ncbi:hypothetical protein ETC05_07810 [Geobacillus sp. BMUD]|uniref:hypothetical protein n=1 Tax=Geobacillus sp. BMUD TaxID=2508876 RepID=UPI00149257A6|nr:hypothetical protein [Geobacillus sp. BMUD]NNU83762.1 hypothetical protein [Geobacillus sp. BMUD]